MGRKIYLKKIWFDWIRFGCWFMIVAYWNTGSLLCASPAVVPDGEGLIQVTVDGLTVDPISRQPVVTLVDSEKNRAFPMWIGFSEARAIHSELQGTKHFRPLTHDLLAGIIEKVDGSIYRVIITHTLDSVFYATLVVKKNDSFFEIDARPSDSIVLALKFNAPIFITQRLFEKMSISLEAPMEIKAGYGINLQEITSDLAAYLSLESNRGLMVSSVRPGSQAEEDGIQTGDILVEIEGQPVTDLNVVKDFMEKSNVPLKARFIRKNKILNITLRLK